MNLKKHVLATAFAALALTGTSFAQTLLIEGLSHPESIALDGDLLYIADIGKEMEPTKKDGDGSISIYKRDGTPVNKAFITGIDAPKGLAVQGNMLVACDVDQLRVFDKKTGKQLKAISFAGVKAQFLNDFVFTGPNVGYISATDLGQVYKVFLESGQMTPVATSEKLHGPNGLAYNAAKNVLVVNEFGGQNGEPGRVLDVNLADGKTSAVPKYQGGLDGMAIAADGSYLVSDWGKMPVGRVSSIGSEMKDITTKPIGGPADFAVDAAGKVVFLPAMLEGKVYVLKY
jgi:sugar lactone lactonase YvrE